MVKDDNDPRVKATLGYLESNIKSFMFRNEAFIQTHGMLSIFYVVVYLLKGLPTNVHCNDTTY